MSRPKKKEISLNKDSVFYPNSNRFYDKSNFSLNLREEVGDNSLSIDR